MTEITEGKKRYVKRSLAAERPTIWIGKSGVTEQILKEITKQLDKNKMVKVKLLATAIADGEAKQIAGKIALETQSFLVEVRGHTFMLYKRRQK